MRMSAFISLSFSANPCTLGTRSWQTQRSEVYMMLAEKLVSQNKVEWVAWIRRLVYLSFLSTPSLHLRSHCRISSANSSEVEDSLVEAVAVPKAFE